VSAEIFPGGGEATEKRKKRPKNSKTGRKIALFKPLPGGGQRKKRPKYSKKHQKIALLSLYFCTMYKNPGEGST